VSPSSSLEPRGYFEGTHISGTYVWSYMRSLQPVVYAIIALELELEPLQPHLFNVLVRDYEESPMRMMDDLDDPTEANYDVNEWFPKDGSNDQD
jgi:hypothetical protein